MEFDDNNFFFTNVCPKLLDILDGRPNPHLIGPDGTNIRTRPEHRI